MSALGCGFELTLDNQSSETTPKVPNHFNRL